MVGTISKRGTVGNPFSAALPLGSYTAIPSKNNLFRRGDGSVVVGDGTSLPANLKALDERGRVSTHAEHYLATGISVPTRDIPTYSTTPISGGVSYAFNTTSVTKVGCYPVTVNTSYLQNQSNTLTNAVAEPWAVEFATAANSFTLPMWAHATTARMWVFVDGQPVGRTCYTQTGLTAETAFNWTVTFSDARLRTIRVYMADSDFGGVIVPAGQSIAATTLPETKKCVYIGDSWGIKDRDSRWPNNIPFLLGRALNWQMFSNTINASGYVNPGTGTVFGSTGRLAATNGIAPDYIIVSGSINDDAQTAVGTAAAALYSSFASSLPGTKLIVVGRQPVIGGYAQGTPQQYADVKAAALAASNVLGFIDPIANRWIDGGGTIAAPTGFGNADLLVASSTTHLSNAGVWQYAALILTDVLRLLEKSGATV